jgi:carbon storage regulator
MLVLSRRIGEEVVIDGGIRVRICQISGDKVRIGIDAPRDVCVDRAEVHERRLDFTTSPESVCSTGN